MAWKKATDTLLAISTQVITVRTHFSCEQDRDGLVTVGTIMDDKWSERLFFSQHGLASQYSRLRWLATFVVMCQVLDGLLQDYICASSDDLRYLLCYGREGLPRELIPLTYYVVHEMK